MGAWIETNKTLNSYSNVLVAPYVGAWIETQTLGDMVTWFTTSHPMWVRGLKHDVLAYEPRQQLVAPYVGAWIETHIQRVR